MGIFNAVERSRGMKTLWQRLTPCAVCDVDQDTTKQMFPIRGKYLITDSRLQWALKEVIYQVCRPCTAAVLGKQTFGGIEKIVGR